MSEDAAELIFFQEVTPDKFFQEAERLGIPKEELVNPGTKNRVFHSCLVNHRTLTAKAVAARLGLSISDEQALSIARNSLVPGVHSEPAPLSADERAIAEELYREAISTAAARQGASITEKDARVNARKMIRQGERGLTVAQKAGRAVGCLVMLSAGLFAFGLMLAFAAVVRAAL
jgi:hypothetical protein